MKFLRTREEIAQEINIKRTPVLTVDLTMPIGTDPLFASCYKGSKVRILGGRPEKYADLETRCTVEMFGDEPGNENHGQPWTYKSIILSNEPTILTGDFTLYDVDNMVGWSNTKLLKPGDNVLLYFRAKNDAYFRLMRVGKRIDTHCETVARLEDVE